ncbi:hypothetical protein GCM10009734_16970 [Nonomuraea bangladeshensis]
MRQRPLKNVVVEPDRQNPLQLVPGYFDGHGLRTCAHVLPPRTSSYGDGAPTGGKMPENVVGVGVIALAPASTTAAGEPPPHASETVTPTEAQWHSVGITSTADEKPAV